MEEANQRKVALKIVALRLCSFFIMILCSSWQFYLTSSDYFSYPIVTQVSYTQAKQLLTAIAVCPHTRKSPFGRKLMPHPMNIRHAMSPKMSDYFESCTLTLPTGETVKCEQVTEVDEYIGPMGQCFAFFEYSSLKVNASELMYDGDVDFPEVLVNFRLNLLFPKMKLWLVRVYHSQEPFIYRRRDNSKKLFEPSTFSSLSVNIDGQIRERLPPPYTDGCFDYRSGPFIVKNKAIDMCTVTNYINRTSGIGYWPLLSYWKIGFEYSNLSKTFIEETNEANLHLLPPINAMCSQRFRMNDCYKESYRIEYKKIQHRNLFLNDTTINIDILSLPAKRLSIIYEPWFTFAYWINNIGGILSLWLGLSALFTPVRLIDFIFTSNRASVGRVKVEKMIAFTTLAHGLSASRWKKLTIITIKCICAIGCIAQCVDIAKIYIENNLYFRLSSVQPEHISFTPFTFCLNKVQFERKGSDLIALPANESAEMTIDQMFNSTIQLDDILLSNESTFIQRESMTYKLIRDYYTWKKRLSDSLVCFTTFSSSQYINEQPLEKYRLSEISFRQYFRLFFRMLDTTYYSRMNLFLHFDETFPLDIASLNQIILLNSQNRLLSPNFLIFYARETRVFYLKSNYRSTCFDYTEIGFSSQKNAIDECVKRKVKSAINVWPTGYLIQYNESRGVKFASPSQDRTINEIKLSCERRLARPHCEQQFLTLHIEDVGFFNTKIEIKMYSPTEEYNELRQEQRYNIVDLIIYIGGNINSWMGVTGIKIAVLVEGILKSRRRFK